MTEVVTQGVISVEMLLDSWEWAAYSELGEWAGGGTPSKSKPRYWKDGNIPWFSPKDMRGLELHNSQDHITEGALRDSAAKLIRAGSLLFVVRSGILRRTLPVALTTVDGAVNQDIKALTPSKSLSALYLLYATLAQKEDIRHGCKKAGTTVESIQVPLLQRYPVPIPPLNEQRRIVEKIEELFTKLDAGVQLLEQTRALLKNYRRSVLKAAVEGELSREWRKAHRGELEPASELLERILQERREKFEGRKYKEPSSPDTSELPALPEGWVWARLGQLGDVIGGLTKNRKREAYPSRLPYLRVANVYANELRLDDVAEIGVEVSELDRALLEDKDLLIVEGNGSPDQIGRVALWDGSISPCVHQNHLIKIRFFKSDMSRYALFWLLSADGREHIKDVASSTSGLYTLSLSKVKALPIPLAPLKEQRFIVEEVERRLSVVDKLAATVEENLRQATGLRQSILKQAFSGELVPQDPNEEPASVLLERIREERQAAKPKPREKSGRARKKAPAVGHSPQLFPEQGA